jgi:CHAD domain-containing protein
VSEPSNRERELKFTVDEQFVLPPIDQLDPSLRADTAETVRLCATYYDTDDLRLARAGASLRFRDDDGWTVKLPRPSDVALVRSELHVDGDAGEPPAAAVDLVCGLVRGAPLQLVARLETVRRRTVVRDEDGVALAEIVDDDVTVHGPAATDTRFRELEVEFTEAAPAKLVKRLARRLSEAGAGDPQHVAKIVRALGPRALDAPDLVAPGEVDVASTPTDVLRAAIARSTARLLAHDPGVRLGGDPEDVHQARVATRRMRSDLRTFRRVLDRGWDESLRAELEWLGDLLGAVRDADVLLARLEERVAALAPDEQPAGERVLDALRAERAAARDELLAAMRSDRYVALLDRLLAAARAVPASADAANFEVDVAELAVKPWKKLRRAVRALGDDPPDAALHQVRIRAKRARYAAEAVAPAVGDDAKEFAERVAELQDVLGEHQDAVVAARWLHDHVPRADGEAGFVAGQLAMMEEAAAEESRQQWPEAWARAGRRALRRWM